MIDKNRNCDFESFLELVERHPEIRNMRESPELEKLNSFYKELINHAFYKRIRLIENFNNAISELERIYLEGKKEIFGDYFDEASPLALACKIERKVRLLVRVLYLYGDVFGKDVVRNDLDRKALMKSLKENMDAAKRAIDRLMYDEIFRESLNSHGQYQIIKGILEADLHWLDSSSLNKRENLFVRATKIGSEESTEKTRYLCDRFADAACRLYGECSVKAIRELLNSFELLEIKNAKIKEIIERAVEIKKCIYLEQETADGMADWRSDELWRYAKGYWSLERSLVSPWFRA